MTCSRPLILMLALAAALAAGGCVSSQDIDELQAQLSEIQRQVLQAQQQAPSKREVESLEASVGQQMGSLLRTEADMQVKLQELSGQIDQLQAQLEDTNYRLAQLSQQIATTNQELKTLRETSPAVPMGAVPPGDVAPPVQQPPPGRGNPGGGGADPKALYDAAYNDYLKGNYDLAMRGFDEYLTNFPETDLADNATYWIGESFYRQKQFRKAIEQFERVANRFPRSDKLAAALLKKGYAHIELNERTQGIAQLRQVLRQYPSSTEANLARQRLRDLGVDV